MTEGGVSGVVIFSSETNGHFYHLNEVGRYKSGAESTVNILKTEHQGGKKSESLKKEKGGSP